MTICYLDPFSGISGDMTVGALVDAGADSEALINGLQSLGTGATFRIAKTKRRGIAASKFSVDFTGQSGHRHLPHIVRMIENTAGLPDAVKQNAIRVFHRLGEAEAKVHDIPIEKVHFHEVGAVDSICDIVGACLGFHLLGVEEIYSGPVNTGSGTVNTEHGVLPVPAPATAELLREKPVYARGPALELTTPTGAAIATALARGFGPLPALTLQSTGFGAGDRDFPEHANVLRILTGTRAHANEASSVTVLEANLDDATPQILGYAMERLLAAGALDVTLEPVQMKKNRPGTLLRIISGPEHREALAAIIFAETPTLGIRFYDAQRLVKPRHIVEVATPHGKIRIKQADGGTFAAEYEDCRQIAAASGVPLREVMLEAHLAYIRQTR